MTTKPRRGRGATHDPANRFEPLEVDWEEPPPEKVPTRYYRDSSRSAITYNSSPDVGFDASLNPYRGCEHGCIYCYARPTHEYLGWSAGLDFESRILVKEDAPELLEGELRSEGWTPQVLALSGVTDPYQPVERKLALTRRCLEVLARHRNPVAVVTKNALVRRDVDLLQELAQHRGARVYLSITSLEPDLTRIMEPRTATPTRRLDAIRTLSESGVPTGVLVAPVIPGLNDHEIPAILEASAEAGVRGARFIVLRLPGAVEPLFLDWLDHHFPDRKGKVLARLRSLREGDLSDSRFGRRMRGEGVFADQIRGLFQLACREHGLDRSSPELSTESFRRRPEQRTLF
ncbi:MAG: PA0069 family radical SAM protein [Thermoanaerobaculia bacterium]|nr:PA0069 family radical SAM protein [Thermoanaerobaculia bacterium]